MRLPLIGPYNTRPSTTSALTTSSGIVGVGVVGVMIVGQTTQASQKDRRFINCYVQAARDELAKTASPGVVKRPGFAEAYTALAGNVGSAIHIWIGQGSGNKVVTGFGATNSTIKDGTSSLGTITGKATDISETTISGTATLAISSTDSTGWFYPDGGALTQITDGDFPGNAGVTLAGTWAHLGGWAFIMGTDGYVYNSDLNSLANWTAGNRFATNAYPDKGVGCIRLGELIIAFGTQSFEVLRNAGTQPPGSPLARVRDSTQKIGATSALAIINVGDVIYFAGATKEGNVSIYAYAGDKARPVSTPEIDAQLLLAGPSNITLSACSMYGNTHIFIRAASITYAYCIEEKGWWEVSSQVPLWDRMDGISIGATIVNYAISTSHDGGKVYVLNPASATYTDDGYAYTRIIQTAANDFGTSNKKEFISVTVVGDQEESQSDEVISWTDDDYQNFNTDPRTVDLSQDHRKISRCGMARKRAFKLVNSANGPSRLQALDIDVKPLTT